MNKKSIEIVAGPNGSGKTTFAESFFIRTQEHPVFLNPDLIASGIAPLDFERFIFDNSKTKPSIVQNKSNFDVLSGVEQTRFIKRFLAGKP